MSSIQNPITIEKIKVASQITMPARFKEYPSRLHFVIVGKCKCGKPAVVTMTKLLGPGSYSKPRKVCLRCLWYHLCHLRKACK